MKKKVALLLVLAMLVSMVPVNVFGNVALVATVGGTIVLPNEAGGVTVDGVGSLTEANIITITIPWSAFHGRSLRQPRNTVYPGTTGSDVYVHRLAIELEGAVILPSDLRSRDELVASNARRFWDGELLTPGSRPRDHMMPSAPWNLPTGNNNAHFQGRRHLAAFNVWTQGQAQAEFPNFLDVYPFSAPGQELIVMLDDVAVEIVFDADGNPTPAIGYGVDQIYPPSVRTVNPVYGIPIAFIGTRAQLNNLTNPDHANYNPLAADWQFLGMRAANYAGAGGFTNTMTDAQINTFVNDQIRETFNIPPGTNIVTPPTITSAALAAGFAGIAPASDNLINLGAPSWHNAGAGVYVTAATVGGQDSEGNVSVWSDPRVSTAQITIVTTNEITPQVTGHITIELPVRGQMNGNAWQDATITARRNLAGQDAIDAVPLINRHRLAGSAVRSVSWSAPEAPRGFSSALHVPALRITENMWGTLENRDGSMVIMLTAPQFYTWSFAPPETLNADRTQWEGSVIQGEHFVWGRTGLNNPLNITAGGVGGGLSFEYPIGSPGATHPTHNEVRIGISHVWGGRDGDTNVNAVGHAATGRHRIWLSLDNFERNALWNLGSGWLEVRNLWLVPDDNAVNVGEVHVDVNVGRMSAQNLQGSEETFRASTVAPGAQFPGNVVFPASFVDTNGTTIQVFPGVTNTSGGTIDIMYRHFEFSRPFNRSSPARLERGVLYGGQYTSLHVGNRGVSGLNIEVHNGPNTVRTGTLGATSVQTWDLWQNRDNERMPFFPGQQTATLIIEENIPGGFVTGFGAPINFEFLDDNGNVHPGIRILGMQARAGNYRGTQWSRGSFNDFFHGDAAIAGPGSILAGGVTRGSLAEQNSNQNWMTFRGYVGALNQRLPNVPNVGRLSDMGATLYLPTQAINDVNPIANHHGNGILEVRFFLSVEAGYEWKYGEDINVTVSGAGVTNLPGGSYTTTIAHARDPITLTVDTGSTSIETGTLYNIPGVQPVSDVIIDVNYNGAFGIANEIWLYVGTDTIGRNFDVNLVNIPTISVNAESGLRLDSGRLMAPATAGHLGRAGVVFTVTRQPYGGDAPAPVLTISNINVEGVAFPDIEYQIVVSGTGIADNDQEVFNAFRVARLNTTVAEAAAMPQMSRGVFTSLPFNETILQTTYGGVWDVAPELAPPAPPPVTLPPPTLGNEFRMWAGMGPIAGIEDPFRWSLLPSDPRTRIGEVSARAFGFFINGVENEGVSFNDDTRQATVSGNDVHGNNVTVILTVGSNIATVNGAAVDIATFAGQSGPPGSISVQPDPATGRIFLPLRFLANAFGRTVSQEGEVVVFR